VAEIRGKERIRVRSRGRMKKIEKTDKNL